MLILIGSQALKYYGRLKGREPADWDFITNDEALPSKNNAEFTHTSNSLTDKEIFDYCVIHKKHAINTPFGKAIVAPLEILKVLKLSSEKHLDKAKHAWDLNILGDIVLDDNLLRIAKNREEEVAARVKQQKDAFFHKYKGVTHYIDHDWMHELINPNPMYLKILVNAVDVSEEKFNKLTESEKRDLVREECLVLSLERELNPRIKKFPFLVRNLVKVFRKTNTSNTAAMRWLSRMSIQGKVKDHPPFVTAWTQKNTDYILDDFSNWWNNKLDNFPVEFWEKLLR